MALKSDMPEESKNSKVIKRDTFSIVFPDDPKPDKTTESTDQILAKPKNDESE
ncbi:hypothetical protein [Listeria aquatica]|uniref:Uncharacterized protein n=1 Tax=Listeria aquatica FSL S10-1188 TaxID=1265818 RepID=W7ASX3_9LIST|nr:hypothetical protein [Listeria aquatica]EUJ16727.1 hypothetical protein MAQA_15246 [Listeria aquatica FSL S10-1188]